MGFVFPPMSSSLRRYNRLEPAGSVGDYRRAERWALFRFTVASALVFAALLVGVWATVFGLIEFLTRLRTEKLLSALVPMLALLFPLIMLAWRLTGRLVFFRRPGRDEVWLRREQAPALFAALDDMRQRLRGPAIRGVVITREMNASAIWHRWFGLWFMPRQYGYISVGLPVLATLSAPEALAVVAHEYGHLAGYPNRWGTLFYNLRTALLELQEDASRWDDRISIWLAGAVRRFVGKYDQLAFEYCRENEYGADAVSAQLVQPEPAVWALVRMQVARHYLEDEFWPGIYAKVSDVPEVEGAPFCQLAEMARAPVPEFDPDRCMRLMRDLLQSESDDGDTHPSLAERVRALGFSPEAMLEDGVDIAPRAAQPALAAWFATDIADELLALDRQWQAAVEPWWRERHRELLEADQNAEARQREKSELAARAEQDAEAAWNLLLMRIDDGEICDSDGAAADYLRCHPNHGPAHFAIGRRWLGEDDKRALRHLHRALDLAPALMPEIRQLLVDFYAESDPERARLYQVMFERGSQAA